MTVSKTFLEGIPIAIIQKDDRVSDTGKVTKAHQVLQFMVPSATGYEIMEIKDEESVFINIKEGQVLKVPYTQTAVINGKKYHKVV